MEIMEFLKTDICLVAMIVSIVILLILYIVNCMKLSSINKKYSQFIKKLGNGKNLDEILNSYIEKVEVVNNRNEEIISYCQDMDREMANCLQKIGVVRYNAFKDTGSDLSFTLALLDDHNNGVVLNGIYSREMSNIYAKPVENGKSTYTLSQEESEAIAKAIQSNGHQIRE